MRCQWGACPYADRTSATGATAPRSPENSWQAYILNEASGDRPRWIRLPRQYSAESFLRVVPSVLRRGRRGRRGGRRGDRRGRGGPRGLGRRGYRSCRGRGGRYRHRRLDALACMSRSTLLFVDFRYLSHKACHGYGLY